MNAREVLSNLAALGVQAKRLVGDSRQVQAGDVFVAYPGEHSDGRRFIAQALAAGADAVLWEQEGFSWQDGWHVPNLAVPHLREQVGPIASAFYGEPSQSLWVVGVTGTNGKTSCSHWLAQSLTALGRKTAVVGTLGNGFPGALSEAINTTPDPILLQGMLADYLKAGAQAVAMEVSSHGLAQGRVNGMKFDIAVLTNLSRDHLDYHGDMAAYAAAKQSLFFWPGLKYVVLNGDDEFGERLAGQLDDLDVVVPGETRLKVMTYGFGDTDVRGSHLQFEPEGLALDVAMSGITKAGTTAGEMSAHLSAPVVGRFNAYNLLAVLSALVASGVALQDAVAVLSQIKPVPGRMQQLGGGDLPLVVVDYAHTPDALEKTLLSLREQTSGQLSCVFGCGGNRDQGKRPLMGEVASRLADSVVITSDNPRHEHARDIIDDIVAGIANDGRAEICAIEDDRAAAIMQAVHQAKAGDVVLIAGKGHETYQEIGGDRFPFSDIEVAARVLASLRGGA
jgi:UDP-N-acetylmuramyl-tripeptide synthetase